MSEAKRSTWAWACEQMLAGHLVRRAELRQGFSVGFNGSEDMMMFFEGEPEDAFVCDADDLRSTRWESAK